MKPPVVRFKGINRKALLAYATFLQAFAGRRLTKVLPRVAVAKQHLNFGLVGLLRGSRFSHNKNFCLLCESIEVFNLWFFVCRESLCKPCRATTGQVIIFVLWRCVKLKL